MRRIWRGQGPGRRCSPLLATWLAVAGLLAAPLLAMPLPSARAAPAAKAGCAPPDGTLATVLAVAGDGGIVLSDGRTVRAAFVDVPDDLPDDLGTAVRTMMAGLTGEMVTIRPVLPAPDRWGRIVAHIFVLNRMARENAASGSFGEELVAAGLALMRTDEPDLIAEPGCLRALALGEARARGRRLGLWASPAHALGAAGDTAGLVARAGRFAVFEGRVVSVGERGERTYINFGRRWNEDTTVTIPKRSWRIMERSGFSAATLRGRKVRVRGLVEDNRGPLVEVTEPHQIEFVETDRDK